MGVFSPARTSSIQNAAACGARAPRPLWIRIGVRLVVAAVALFVLYLVAINVFIRTRLFRNAVNADPSTFTVEYANAYSVFPARIHVEGLMIRSRDHHVEFLLAIDRCDFRVSFADLFRHRFTAHHVRGDGVSLRVRLRLDPKGATPDVVADLPPVPGFGDPPLLDPAGVPPPLTDANYNLWSVDLEDVDAANVREIWIQTVRMMGDMHIDGRFILRPVRWLEVGPAHVDAHRVELTEGRRALATKVDGVIDATVHGFDVRQPEGLEVFKYVSVDTDLHGELATANLIDLAKIDGVKIAADRRDPFEARVRLDEGTVQHGTHIETRTHLRTRIGPTEVTGSVKARLVAESRGPKGAPDAVDVSGSTIALDDVATEQDPKTRDWWAKIALRDARFSGARAPRFHGFLDATARDAEPAVAIVAGNTGVPMWLAKVFGMHDLHAHAELRVAPGTLDVLSAEVKGNDAASIRADYVKRFDMKNGAVLCELGPLSVGVKLGDDSGLELLGATSWFERQAAWLHARAER